MHGLIEACTGCDVRVAGAEPREGAAGAARLEGHQAARLLGRSHRWAKIGLEARQQAEVAKHGPAAAGEMASKPLDEGEVDGGGGTDVMGKTPLTAWIRSARPLCSCRGCRGRSAVVCRCPLL